MMEGSQQDSHALLEKHGGIEGLAEKLKTDLKAGLPVSEANNGFRDRIDFYGDNTYPEAPTKSWFELWWEAAQDTTIIILCIAAVVSLVLGIAVPEEGEENTGWIEGAAILIAVMLVTCVTATNEWTQEQQFRDLNKVKENR